MVPEEEEAETLSGGESLGRKESVAARCRAGVVCTVPWSREAISVEYLMVSKEFL